MNVPAVVNCFQKPHYDGTEYTLTVDLAARRK